EESDRVGVRVARRRDGKAGDVGLPVPERRVGGGERVGEGRLGRHAAWTDDLPGVCRLLALPDRRRRTHRGLHQHHAQVRRLPDPRYGRVAKLGADPRRRHGGSPQAEAAAREKHNDPRQRRPGPVAAARRPHRRARADGLPDRAGQRETPLRRLARPEGAGTRAFQDPRHGRPLSHLPVGTKRGGRM
ncbi:MAG: Dihydrofolate reductase, partial [uncultured Rubrobacteraceae bacterium]